MDERDKDKLLKIVNLEEALKAMNFHDWDHEFDCIVYLLISKLESISEQIKMESK